MSEQGSLWGVDQWKVPVPANFFRSSCWCGVNSRLCSCESAALENQSASKGQASKRQDVIDLLDGIRLLAVVAFYNLTRLPLRPKCWSVAGVCRGAQRVKRREATWLTDTFRSGLQKAIFRDLTAKASQQTSYIEPQLPTSAYTQRQ